MRWLGLWSHIVLDEVLEMPLSSSLVNTRELAEFSLSAVRCDDSNHYVEFICKVCRIIL